MKTSNTATGSTPISETRDAGDPQVLAAWQHLQDLGAVHSPFLTAQWHHACIRTPGAFETLRTYVARNKSETVGILPIEISRDERGLRTAGFPGQSWIAPDHMDVLAAPGFEAATAAAVLDALVRDRAIDVIDLDAISANGHLAAALARSLPARVRALAPTEMDVCYVDLARGNPRDSWSKNLRQRVNSGLNKTRKAGGDLYEIRNADELAGALDEMFALHNAQFGTASKAYATAERREFHKRAARCMAESGRARLYRLAVPDETLAILYCFVNDNTLHYYSGARGTSKLARSPGLSAHGEVIERAAAEGFDEYDFMRGDHDFKKRFATSERTQIRARFVRANLRTASAAVRVGARRLAGKALPHKNDPDRTADTANGPESSQNSGNRE